jgi:hypothetical protein
MCHANDAEGLKALAGLKQLEVFVSEGNNLTDASIDTLSIEGADVLWLTSPPVGKGSGPDAVGDALQDLAVGIGFIGAFRDI